METADVNLYREQLFQVTQALHNCDDNQRDELLILKNNIEELLALANDEDNVQPEDNESDNISKEYELFMAEMEKEGAVSNSSVAKNDLNDNDAIEQLGNIEGKKCKAPHTHQWGNITYHNAMICSVFQEDGEIKVRVLFTNPTHQEMLPCPYYYESDCKFSEDKCRFSHGEIVLYSSLQDYIEPKFDLLSIGSPVLAKQQNNLWQRAIIQKLFDNKCIVKFECNKKSDELLLEHIFPLDNNDIEIDNEDDMEIRDETEIADREDIINMSLLITPSSDALGNWEKYTKGIGSKLMQKMGYIFGTGLGKNAEGRIDPVTAVILPRGKSLDHCMELREQAGGDKNLFSVERKLKRLQKKQEMQNEKAYKKLRKKGNVFDFINTTLTATKEDMNCNIKAKLKEESHRSLNIQNLKIAGNMKKIEENLLTLRNSLNRHVDTSSNTHQMILTKISEQQDQLRLCEKQALLIKNELDLRSDRKKMTEF